MGRTVIDWLSHARAASDPEEIERALEQAVDIAASCHEWRGILALAAELPSVSRERVSAIADRTLASAESERQIWGFRDVAAVRATRLADEGGARAALEAAEATFRTPRSDVLGEADELLGGSAFARGYEWVLLAEGYAATLDDAAGVRRCLEAGRDMARKHADADDLASIATAWAKQIDRAEGALLLHEAEALAENGTARAWTLANAWSAIDEPLDARRVLDAALAAATTSDDAVHVAKAWTSHGSRDDSVRALARARELAATADEWLDVGEAAFDAALDADAIRACVRRAEELAQGDEELRGRVSAAYLAWLEDDASAARIGPRGVRPEALRVRVRTLEGWEASASALFDWLRARVTPEILTRIAHADYGMDASKHLAALEDLCATGLLPRELPWVPHEVLALTRWSTGETVNHVERALACVILCLVPGGLDELVTNGVILAESCLALGAEAIDRAERLFTWRAETEEPPVDEEDIDPERPVALLLLLLLRAAEAPDDARLEPLASMLTADPRSRAPFGPSAAQERGPQVEPEVLAGRIAGSIRAELWRELIDRILVPLGPAHAHPHVAALLEALRRR